jgi:hemoglobin-like flavoprotein
MRLFRRREMPIRPDQVPVYEPVERGPGPSADEWMPTTEVIPREEAMTTEPQTEPDRELEYDQPEPVAPPFPVRETCGHCRGTGYVLTTNDLLRESIGLLGENGNEAMRIFYSNLLEAAPDLAAIFPRDLLTTDETRMQRDKLLGALVAVAQNYDPDNPQSEGMRVLKEHLAVFGRSHKAFRRADGTTSGAMLAEYNAVGVILLNTLHDLAGDAWLPEYDAVWVPAYDRIAKWMIHFQVEAEETAGEWSGRFPRPAQ